MLKWNEPIINENEHIWFSEDGKYRVAWRDKYMGVSVAPKYIACGQIQVDDKTIWDLISRHNKLGPAQKACNRYARQQKKLLKEGEPKKTRRRSINRGITFGKGT